MVWCALGVDLGWRGFLFPRLRARHAFPNVSALSGYIWAVRQFPLILQGGYLEAPSLPLGMLLVLSMIWIIGQFFVVGWFSHSRQKSTSVPLTTTMCSHGWATGSKKIETCGTAGLGVATFVRASRGRFQGKGELQGTADGNGFAKRRLGRLIQGLQVFPCTLGLGSGRCHG